MIRYLIMLNGFWVTTITLNHISNTRIYCIFDGSQPNLMFLGGNERWACQHENYAKIVQQESIVAILQPIWKDVHWLQKY